MPRKLLITKADYIILFLAIIGVIGLYGYYWHDRSESATYAIILTPYHDPRRVNLMHDQWITVMGTLGETVLQVESGRIRFFSSACHNKYCVHHGWLQQGGDFLACIPNQVSVELYSEIQQSLDAITY